MMKSISCFFVGRNIYSTFLHLTLLVLAIEVAILAKQNHELKEKIGQSLESLKIGDYFAMDDLVSLQPDYRIDSTSRYLLFIFTTTCPFCKQNLEHWNQVANKTWESNTHKLGISLDGVDETSRYLKDNNVVFPVVCSRDAKNFQKKNKIEIVPTTVARNDVGKVENMWAGLLNQKEIQEVIDACSHKLNH